MSRSCAILEDHPAQSIRKEFDIACIVSQVFSTAAWWRKKVSISPSPSLKMSVIVSCKCLARSDLIFLIGSEQSNLDILSITTGTKDDI